MIAITNRHLCERDFLEQIEILAQREDIEAIILREKDLAEDEYRSLASHVLACCAAYHKKCILHSFIHVARELGCPRIHLPLPILMGEVRAEGQDRSGRSKEGAAGTCRTAGAAVGLEGFTEVGTSVHSVAEAREAVQAGATYLIAGHIFETDCKKGLPGRGLAFLHEVCQAVDMPVYGIGGITPERLPALSAAGAAGGCAMSSMMR